MEHSTVQPAKKQGQKQGQGQEIDFKWFLISLLLYWKWFLLSIIIFLFGGFVYLRYTTPVYQVNAKIMMKDSKIGGMQNSDLDVFEAMGFLKGNSAVVLNEIQVLKARDMLQNVVVENDLFIKYIIKGRFKDTELFGDANPKYYASAPVKILADSSIVASLHNVLSLNIAFTGQSTYKVSGQYGASVFSKEFKHLPATFDTPVGELLLYADNFSVLRKEYPLLVQLSPPLWAANSYIGALGITLLEKGSTVVSLSLQETNRQRGEVFLSGLIDLYNRDSMKDKNKAASNASHFVNERLVKLNEELIVSEKNVEAFKQANQLTIMATETTNLLMADDNEHEKRLVEIETDLTMLSYIEREIRKVKSDEILLPSSIGLASSSLSIEMENYNRLVAEQKNLLNYSNGNTPSMIELNERIERAKEAIASKLRDTKYTLNTRKRENENFLQKRRADIQNIPRVERELMELIRKKEAKLQLVGELMRRKESIDLTLAVTAPSAKILESPLSGGIVAPRRSLIYMICSIIGIIFPFIVLGLRDLLNYKVNSEEDVRRYTQVPVIASIPLAKNTDPVVVKPNSTSSITELFRLLRTNLQFILNKPAKKVILITSSISGEGKTYMAINLAMTFSLKYRTLLVGLDIRRPKITSYLGLAKNAGLLSYLTGNETSIAGLIQKNYKNTNLDVLVSGVIPPNPNELLMEETLDKMFREIRERYDYVIVDTSPVGSVSDAFLINRIADASLFVIRKDIAPKSAISLINNIWEKQRLKNVNIILNAFDDGKIGPYGYNYGYSYGYTSKDA